VQHGGRGPSYGSTVAVEAILQAEGLVASAIDASRASWEGVTGVSWSTEMASYSGGKKCGDVESTRWKLASIVGVLETL
jgi:hypothetical protein